MPLEQFKAGTLRMKHFDTHLLFNEWASKQKGIVIINIVTAFAGTMRSKVKGQVETTTPLWRVLVTYSELPKATED